MLNHRKMYFAFFIVLLLTSLVIISFNFIIDPFGAFGDNFLKMYNYDMSQNMRIAKISYLDKNNKNFDSYIIGGSKSGALMPEIVNKYYPNSNFYNLNMIGGKFYDYEKTIDYIVNNYNVKNIILQISQLEADTAGTATNTAGRLHGKLTSDFPLEFYLKILLQSPSYSFKKLKAFLTKDPNAFDDSFYNIKTGSYNYTGQEERIKTEPDKYFNNQKFFPNESPLVKNTVFEYNFEIIKRIVDFCNQKNVKLLLITSPTYKTEIDSYPHVELGEYMKNIASVANYWNFSGYNSININKTNFYNSEHFRITVAEMMFARIFDNKSIKVPDDFGKYITSENSEAEINKALKLNNY